MRAGELTCDTLTICEHGAVELTVIESTIWHWCSGDATAAALAVLVKDLPAERGQRSVIGLRSPMRHRARYRTTESFQRADGLPRLQAVRRGGLRQNETKSQIHAS